MIGVLCAAPRWFAIQLSPSGSLCPLTSAPSFEYGKINYGIEYTNPQPNQGNLPTKLGTTDAASYDATKGIIQIHPMARYGRIPEDEKALRVMDLEEERSLINAVLAKNHVIGCYVGVLGETALRMTEGLLLKWKFVNLGERNLTVEASKNYKTRHVPLSDYAIELLRSLPRVIGCEYVFALALTKDRWRDPRGPFYAGRKAVDLEWVGFHDFRHFRASQWVMRGILASATTR